MMLPRFPRTLRLCSFLPFIAFDVAGWGLVSWLPVRIVISLFRTLEPPPVTVVVLTCPMTAHLTKAIFLELLVSNVEPLVGLSKPAHVVPKLKDSLVWTTCSLHIFEVAVHTIIVSGVLHSLVITIVLVTMLLFGAL